MLVEEKQQTVKNKIPDLHIKHVRSSIKHMEIIKIYPESETDTWSLMNDEMTRIKCLLSLDLDEEVHRSTECPADYETFLFDFIWIED